MKNLMLLFFSILTLAACKSSVKQESNNIYESEDLLIRKLSDKVYLHISYLNTQSFGKVSCNGMIVVDENEAIIFDTPTDDKASHELIEWISNTLESKTLGIVATHFHEDCLGGLNEFHKNSIPSYANNSTIEFAKSNGSALPQNGFDDSLALAVGNEEVYLEYFGEGHTKDNIIGYFPNEKIMFGGCLMKEIGAGKGNLEDANTEDWANTVRKIKNKYPDAKTIIPGHGELGGQELLDFTIKLFETNRIQ
jgi:metallo-beta-lactamase class B